ncbi:MAG: hypothetical protein KBD06_04830 [Candidatus Pacebacteria bacterium]|nr:hypothetical protein [Candidatus Paceibacterota bacterium]
MTGIKYAVIRVSYRLETAYDENEKLVTVVDFDDVCEMAPLAETLTHAIAYRDVIDSEHPPQRHREETLIVPMDTNVLFVRRKFRTSIQSVKYFAA